VLYGLFTLETGGFLISARGFHRSFTVNRVDSLTIPRIYLTQVNWSEERDSKHCNRSN